MLPRQSHQSTYSNSNSMSQSSEEGTINQPFSTTSNTRRPISTATLESVESPRFNDDRIKAAFNQSTSSQQYLQSQMHNSTTQLTEDAQRKPTTTTKTTPLSQSLQRYKNMMNSLNKSDRSDATNISKLSVSVDQQKQSIDTITAIPISSKYALEQENSLNSSSSSITNSRNNMEEYNNIADRFRQMRESDDTDKDSEQSFDQDLSNRLKIIENNRKTKAQQQMQQLQQQQQMSNAMDQFNTFVSNSQISLTSYRQNDTITNLSETATNRNLAPPLTAEHIQQFTKNDDNFEKPNVQNNNNNNFLKQWENHVQRFQEQSSTSHRSHIPEEPDELEEELSHNSKSSSISNSRSSTISQQQHQQSQQQQQQQLQLIQQMGQSPFGRQQTKNTGVTNTIAAASAAAAAAAAVADDDDYELDASSILQASHLNASDLSLFNNNQKSLQQTSMIGINQRFKNSTLHSRYSFLEGNSNINPADQSQNISDTSDIKHPNLLRTGGYPQTNQFQDIEDHVEGSKMLQHQKQQQQQLDYENDDFDDNDNDRGSKINISQVLLGVQQAQYYQEPDQQQQQQISNGKNSNQFHCQEDQDEEEENIELEKYEHFLKQQKQQSYKSSVQESQSQSQYQEQMLRGQSQYKDQSMQQLLPRSTKDSQMQQQAMRTQNLHATLAMQGNLSAWPVEDEDLITDSQSLKEPFDDFPSLSQSAMDDIAMNQSSDEEGEEFAENLVNRSAGIHRVPPSASAIPNESMSATSNTYKSQQNQLQQQPHESFNKQHSINGSSTMQKLAQLQTQQQQQQQIDIRSYNRDNTQQQAQQFIQQKGFKRNESIQSDATYAQEMFTEQAVEDEDYDNNEDEEGNTVNREGRNREEIIRIGGIINGQSNLNAINTNNNSTSNLSSNKLYPIKQKTSMTSLIGGSTKTKQHGQSTQRLQAYTSTHQTSNLTMCAEKIRFSEQTMDSEQQNDAVGEIISDTSTRVFVRKYFGPVPMEFRILFDHFLECIFREFQDFLQFSDEIERMQFCDALHAKLTTGDEERVSLNALQIFTREGSLKDKCATLAQSIRANTKQRQKSAMNERIADEINQISKMLDAKSKSLAKREKVIAESEKAMRSREESLMQILKSEFDLMILSLDDAMKERQAEVNKKAAALEKTLKAKLKLIEAKAKEIKSNSSTSLANADKLKSKNASLEKQNEFLKIKLQDSEKKYALEVEANAAFSSKHEILLKKFKEIEKVMREQDNFISSITASNNNHNLTGASRNQRNSHSPNEFTSPLSYSESAIDLQSNNNNQRESAEWRYRGQQAMHMVDKNMPSPIRGNSFDNSDEYNYDNHNNYDDSKAGETTLNEINAVLVKSNGTITPSSSKHPAATAFTIPIEKKKGTTSTGSSLLKKKAPIGAMGSTTTTDEEIVVLLSIIDTLMNNVKTTLPLIVQNERMHNQNTLQQQQQNLNLNESACYSVDTSMLAAKQEVIDIGEIFYPCFNNLIGCIVEVVPSLLAKQFSATHIYGLVDLMTRTIGFKFRYIMHMKKSTYSSVSNNQNKVATLLSEEILESSRTMNKSNQDHINEIMMNPKQPSELTFLPTTAFWKRKVKVLPKKSTATTTTMLTRLSNSAAASQALFLLFSNEDVQKELVNVFKAYLDHSTNVLMKKKASSQLSTTGTVATTQSPSTGSQNSIVETGKNATQLSLESLKQILMTRIDLQLMTVILQTSNKESIIALEMMKGDINNENDYLNDFLRSYLVGMDLVSILVYRMEFASDDAVLMNLAVDLILTLNTNGSYYKDFIADISEDSIVHKLIAIFEKFTNNQEISTKLSVIIQRIAYHNPDLRTRIPAKSLNMFKNKLLEVQRSKSNSDEIQFFLNNLKSIITNLS